jgi:PAS domain S-box-containing protein
MNKSYPLSYAIPGVLLVVSLALACALIGGDVYEANRNIEKEARHDLDGIGKAMVDGIEYCRTNGMPATTVWDLALQRGPYVINGSVFDESNLPLALLGPKLVANQKSPVNPNLLESARSHHTAQFQMNASGDVLAGAFPLALASAPGMARLSSVGVLYLELDLRPQWNRQLEMNFRRAGVIAILIFIWCFLTWSYLDQALTQRIAGLIAVTRQLASGNLTEVPSVAGKDELAELGRVLRQMAIQGQARTKALSDSEEQYRQIVETAEEGIFTMDAEFQLGFVNQRLAGMLGHTTDSMMEHFLQEFFCREDWPELQNKIMQRQPHGTSRHECRLLGKDGGEVWVRMSLTVLQDAAGGFSGAVGMVTDLTGHKRAQQQLLLQSSALMACANAIVITNPAGSIEWINPAFTRLTGYAEAEALGQMMRLLKSGRHLPEFYTQLWRTILDGKTWEGQIINRRRDGSVYTEHMTIVPMLDEQGKIAHYIAIKEKVAERPC